jgi:hypothetical protein
MANLAMQFFFKQIKIQYGKNTQIVLFLRNRNRQKHKVKGIDGVQIIFMHFYMTKGNPSQRSIFLTHCD